MLKLTLAAVFGAVVAQAAGVLQETAAPKGGLTPEQRDVLSHMKVVFAPDGEGRVVPTILIEGVNVQIANGTGSMESTNGRGNLIVGYQTVASVPRTGSHNVVVGHEHSYSSYGGIVSGDTNQLLGPNSVAIGGSVNVVRGEGCVVLGGLLNEVDGRSNVVVAGDTCSSGRNAEHCAIISGWGGTIVDGGQNVIVSGQGTSIAGGSFNAVITGGGHEIYASDYVGVVSGSDHDIMGGAFAAVLGGERNFMDETFYNATFVGGQENTVGALHGTVIGGLGNQALGEWSTVGGGLNRTAHGDFDWVAGALVQDQ